jgi:ZIP family zinc transporter
LRLGATEAIVIEALVWGVVAAATLVVGAAIAFVRPPSSRLLGLVMGFGAGVLLSAVAYELVDEALETEGRLRWTTVGLLAGALVFTAGDELIEYVGARTQQGGGGPEGGGGLPIVLGAMLDGIPESAVLGLTVLQTGEVGVSMLVAVLVSNLPEGIAATTDLLEGGWSRGRILALWLVVVAASGVSAALGYALLDGASPTTLAFILAFAGGAILTMLATSMTPEAYERGGEFVGLASVIGFATAVGVNWLGT